MPRRDKTRDIQIIVDKDAVKEAMAQWVQTHHNIQVDRKNVNLEIDPETKEVSTVKIICRPVDNGSD